MAGGVRGVFARACTATRPLVLGVGATLVAGLVGAAPIRAQEAGSFTDQRFAPVVPSAVDGDTAVVALAAVPAPDGDEWVGAIMPRYTADVDPAVVPLVEVRAGLPGGPTLEVSTPPASRPEEGSGVWAELGGRPVTPVFSYDALVGSSDDGSLPGSSWGTVAVNGVVQPGAVSTGVPSPSLSMLNRAVEVTTVERPPAALLEQPVVGVRDFVRLAPDEVAARTGSDFIIIDRVSGDVQLIEGSGGAFADVTGDRSWVGQGPVADDPGAPGTLVFDLPMVAELVGIDPDPAGLAVSSDRVYELADGRVVTAYGVAATGTWFADAAEQAAGVPEVLATTTVPPTVELAAPDEGDSPVVQGVVLALAVAAVVAVLVLVIVAFTRRARRARRRRRSPDEALAMFDAEMGRIRREPPP